jgi:hypothetical protein
MHPDKLNVGVVPLAKWNKRMSEVADLRTLLLIHSLMEMSSSVSAECGLLVTSAREALRSWITWNIKQTINSLTVFLQLRSLYSASYYFRTTVTNWDLVCEELRGDWLWVILPTIQSRTLLSSCLLSKNVKIRIYKTIIFCVVLYGCEAWSLILRNTD